MLNKKIILGMAALVLLAAAVWFGGCGTSPKPGDTSGKNDKSCDKCDEYNTSVKKDDCNQESCGVIKERAKKGWFGETLFRHRWWNYYERAMSWAECGKWECAVADLQEALKQRSKDQWDARTYGMRFVDYFPNRELGIAYYYLGEFEKAKNCLECSLEWTPSDKSLVYLERSYLALTEERRYHSSEETKIPKPKITLSVKLTRDDPVVISGTVEDEKLIKSIRINDEPVFLLNSSKDIKRQEQDQPNNFRILFDKQILLSEGTHPIIIEAENIIGDISRNTENMKIQVDRSGPTIIIDNKEWSDNPSNDEEIIIISGSISDLSGVAKFFINENEISVEKGKEIYFKETVFTETADNPIKIVACDQLGNQTSIFLPLSSLSYNNKQFSSVYASLTHENEFFYLPDNIPPTIKVKNLKNGQKFYRRNWHTIEVDIEDKSNITSVRINNKENPYKKGMLISFCKEIDLRIENIIEAIDEKGNKSTIRILTDNKKDEIKLIANNLLTPYIKNASDIIAQATPTSSSDTISCIIQEPQAPFDKKNRLSIYVSPFDFTYMTEKNKKEETAIQFKKNLTDRIEKKYTLHKGCERFNIFKEDTWDTKILGNLPSILITMDNKKELKEIVEKLGKTKEQDAPRCFMFGENRENAFFIFSEDHKNYIEKIKSMINQEFPNRLEFIRGLRENLRVNNIRSNIIYERIVSECAEKKFYSLIDSYKEELSKHRVSEDIISKLFKSQINSETKEQFENAVKKAIGEEEYKNYERMILYYVEADCKHRLTEQDFGKLSNLLSDLSTRMRFGFETMSIMYDDSNESMDLQNDISIINTYEENKELLSQLPWELTDRISKKSPDEWIADELEVEFPYAESKVNEIIKEEKLILIDMPENITLKSNSNLIIYEKNGDDIKVKEDIIALLKYPPKQAVVNKSEECKVGDGAVTQ